MKKIIIAITIILIAVLCITKAGIFKTEKVAPVPVMAEAEPTCVDEICGIETCSYNVEEGEIPQNSFLSTLLQGYGVAYNTVMTLVEKSEAIFDVRRIRVKQPFVVLSKNDKVDYFIYKENTTDFVVFDMVNEDPEVYKFEKPVYTEEKSSNGIINHSLYEAMRKSGLTPGMAVELANVFAWQIDFSRIQPGDEFKVLYDEKTCDEEVIATGNVKAAILTHNDREYHAYAFNGDYYDDEGKALRSMFLKSPVEFSRISSKFNKRRRHPIKKRIIPHLGTDYAAPRGTPIIAVASGVITKSGYSKGNGKYVKIKHNGTYDTQYLHMSKRAVKVGEQVKQGDIIGYVGSTGLATGPHVCFRFWKNGVQINHLKADLPVSDPLDENKMEEFHEERKVLRKRLDNMSFSPVL